MSERIPDAWRLAIALDDVAHQLGWHAIGRTTADEEVSVIYQRDRPRRTSPDDQIPAMIADLPGLPKPRHPPIEDH